MEIAIGSAAVYNGPHDTRSNTLLYPQVRADLVASGFTEKQAEALAHEQISLLNSNLATKADIASTRADIEALRLPP